MATETVSADALALEALLVSREYLYTLFHMALGGTPSADLLDALASQVTINTVEEYAQDNASMAGFVDFVRSLAARDAAELLDAAKTEYMHVFVGPAALPASPYESPYRGKHDMALFQANTVVVRRAYREHGYQVRHVMRVPDDHVAIMCDFMAKLGERSVKALQAGDAAALAATLRDQQVFIENHLAGWLGVYAKAVRTSKVGAGAVLYPQLIEAVDAFVACDRIFCQEAAYWAEGVRGENGSSKSGSALAAHEPRFPEVEAAALKLGELELLGIDDNTLVDC